MANEQTSSRPWIVEAAPYLVGLLIASHVLALIGHAEAVPKEKDPLKTKRTCPLTLSFFKTADKDVEKPYNPS